MPKRKTLRQLPNRAPTPALRYWRKLRGLTVQELSEALRERDCFISAPRIYHWEQGEQVMLVYTRALAAILDTTVEALRAKAPEVRA